MIAWKKVLGSSAEDMAERKDLCAIEKQLKEMYWCKRCKVLAVEELDGVGNMSWVAVAQWYLEDMVIADDCDDVYEKV